MCVESGNEVRPDSSQTLIGTGLECGLRSCWFIHTFFLMSRPSIRNTITFGILSDIITLQMNKDWAYCTLTFWSSDSNCNPSGQLGTGAGTRQKEIFCCCDSNRQKCSHKKVYKKVLQMCRWPTPTPTLRPQDPPKLRTAEETLQRWNLEAWEDQYYSWLGTPAAPSYGRSKSNRLSKIYSRSVWAQSREKPTEGFIWPLF